MHYIGLYPQNGDPIVTIDDVTSLHPIHTAALIVLLSDDGDGSLWRRRSF